MATFTFVLFWAPIAFGLFVAASYVGTTLALRSYFEDETPSIGGLVRVDDDGGR